MFRSFQAVPFAAPPVDSLRFGAPQPVTPWTGERKASGWEDIKCIQYGFLYDEDPKVRRKPTHYVFLIEFLIGSRDGRLLVPECVHPCKCHGR